MYRKRWSLALAGGFVVFLGIYYFIPSFTGYISAFFGGSSTTSSALLQNFSALGNYLGATSLPTGYLWILGIFSIPLWIIHFDQRSTPESKNLRYLVVLTTLYTLLFVVAAFGIVWYGILMYFLFLALIVHIISPLTVIENEDHEPIGLGIGLGLLILILPYFLHSGIPNTWNNLPEDSFEYKSGKITGLEATFSRREEYLSTLSKINLLSPTPVLDELKKEVTQDDLRTLLENIPSDTPLDQVVNILVEKESIASTSPAYQGFALEARKLRNLIYERIVHPTDDNKNSQKILRIGTFLTYYISENRSRYFDDSLIFEFSRYLHDTDSKVTLDRLKKLGVRYMLVDLNAATIDRDPARNLTKRYESLIETLDDPGLSLITTDSPCLRMALEKK